MRTDRSFLGIILVCSLACFTLAALTLPAQDPQRKQEMTPDQQSAATTPRAQEVAPTAAVRPVELEKHGHVRTDNYYWLRERDNPEVIAYLEAENAYADAVMAHTKGMQESLFEEITGRIKKDDASVPYFHEGYWYYTRFEKEKEYAIYCRKKGTLEAEEQVMLDVNELAQGHDFFDVRGVSVSSGRDILAYGTDTTGRRLYTVRFKNLDTGETLPDEIPNVTGNVAWANDNRTLFYSRQDMQTLRWDKIYRHEVGSDTEGDVLVYEEKDEEFSLFVYKTKSKAYLIIGSNQTESSEYRTLDANDPAGEFSVIQPREAKHEYSVDHFEGSFYIRTNWDAKNFRLMRTPVGEPARENWKEVIAHREDVLLGGFEIFEDHLVVSERSNGLNQMRIMPWAGGEDYYLDFGEPAYQVGFGANPEFETNTLRYVYTSMTTPPTTYDYDMVTHERRLLKQQEVLGGFDRDDYVTERVFAPARDGVQVPVSLVRRKDTSRDGSAPLLLYGYGSYGFSRDATFSSSRLSLLDRGFVFAIAHIRGGQEMGRWWYEDGKMGKKMNTFTDFIDCAEYLVEEKYAAPGQLYAMGGSAGGLLMGAVINLRPNLFRGVVAAVPFVDVVTTMLDDSIPLTTSEYDEWGNPNIKEEYETMLAYSPYDNVVAAEYPHMLVTTGLTDSQVQYWEPAKWVAKLRALKTDTNRLIFKTYMGAGHSGESGRFRQFRESALIYSFLLDLAGKAEAAQ